MPLQHLLHPRSGLWDGVVHSLETNAPSKRPVIAVGGKGGTLPKGRPHDLHVVFCHKILVRLGIDTLSFRKHYLEPAGRHTEQQNTGLCPDVLERVRSSSGNEDKGPGGCAHNTFAQFEVELTA